MQDISKFETDRLQRSLRLLVVDDDASQRTLLARAARQAGFTVTETASCLETIEQLRCQPFDCVTLDLQLEDGNGTLVVKAMGDAGFSGELLIISGMDAAARAEARGLARSTGIKLRSLPKPVDLSALRVHFANLRQTTNGLPQIHQWGGIAVGELVGQYRNDV